MRRAFWHDDAELGERVALAFNDTDEFGWDFPLMHHNELFKRRHISEVRGFSMTSEFDCPNGYTAGQGAAYKGQPISTCPYKPGNPAGADWRRGWLSGATDTRLDVTPRDRDVVGTHGRVIAPARRTA